MFLTSTHLNPPKRHRSQATRHAQLAASGLIASLFLQTPAWADDKGANSKAACLTAYEQVQTDRSAGKLSQARESAISCAAPECPKAISTECTEWLGEIDKALPSVVFSVKSADNKELFDVRVGVDGAELASSIEALALPIDPGKHTFRFTSKEHGEVETTVIIREGEKNVLVSASFAKPADAGAPPSVPQGESGGPSAAFWVLGAVGTLGVGVGITFEALGLAKQAELEDCKPRCAREDADEMTRNFIVGDVSLAVGVVGLAAATLVGLLESGPPDPAAKAGALPLYGGPTGRASLGLAPIAGATGSSSALAGFGSMAVLDGVF